MDGRQLRVSAISIPVDIGDVAQNLVRIAQALRTAVGAQLIVLPELATSGYVFQDRAEAIRLALRVDDPRLTGLATCLRPGAVAVVGFCEVDGGELFNSALVLDRRGVLGCYRKSHLWDAEQEIFTPGERAGAVFDTPIGRLGVAICYDNEFPELPRQLALAGADVLALPVNWPMVSRPPGEYPPETIQAMAAARSSRLATVIADRHGDERGVAWTGGTAVISADGWIVSSADHRNRADAVLDLYQDKAIGPHNDLFADRRPDLYGDIVVPQYDHHNQKRGIRV
ncbi:MAG: carbon-nitrogen hydrolase [Mycolicibacterium cosmeticum]|nr:carbon-nitrogen hydrolase [Mycolicibacterium cosmeticum]